MRKFLHPLYERAWPSRWGPTLLLTALALFATVAGAMAQTTLVQIGAGGATSSGGFENAAPTGVPATDFPANNWTVVNGATNRLYVGTAGTQASGAYHAFTGPDDVTWSTSAAGYANHIYRDITIPPGEPIVTVNFRYKINTAVDATFDYVRVNIVDLATTPTAGTPLATGQIGQIDGTLTYTNYSVSGLATPGTTVRVVITVREDAFAPFNASAIDDISVVSSAPVTYTSTLAGGLWNSPATWVGGIVPPAGNSVVIPNGSHVMLNQIVNLYDLDINGTLTYATNNRMTINNDLTIGATGRAHFSTATLAAVANVDISGNMVNNGYCNAAAAVLHWPGTIVGNRSLTGTGTWAGDGTRGIIRSINALNLGTFTINTTQNLTVVGNGTVGFTNPPSAVGMFAACTQLATNNKLRIDNSAGLIDNQVRFAVVTNMGLGYTTAPVAFGTAVTAWTNGGAAAANTRYYSGTDVYLCTAAGTFGGTAPVNTTPVTEANGTATVLWIGNLGNIGNPFQVTAVTLGTQYFCGDNLYTCTVAGTPSAAAPPTHVTGTAASGTATFAYVGTVAKISLNYDGTNQVVRSATMVSNGSGYGTSTIPIVVTNTGAGAGAVIAASMFTATGPTTYAAAVRTTNNTVTGTIDIRSSAGPEGSGIGSVVGFRGGYYTVAPTVGFSAPSFVNLVTAQGAGYTSAPTVTVAGGTLISGVAIASGDFQVNIAEGRIISVYYIGAATKIYSVPPTISITGGGGAGATLNWGAGGAAWPTATANLNANGQLDSYTVTNEGYGYSSATLPGAALSLPGLGEAAAGAPTARLSQYYIRNGWFAPQTANPLTTMNGFVPANNRILTLEASVGINLGANLEVYGLAALNMTGGLNLNTFTLTTSHPDYTGFVPGINAQMYGGSVQLSLRGGQTSATRTFPLGGGAGAARYGVFVTGAGAGAPFANGYTYTGLRATTTGAPSGAVSPAGNTTGTRSMRIQPQGSGVLSNLNTGKTFQLFYNFVDNLISDNPSLFLAEAGAVTGLWTIRSAAGVAGPLPATGSRTTATVAPGPISNSSDYYFAFVSNGFTPPAALAYNVVRTTGITYNSIAPVGLGGDGSGTAFTGWTSSIANDEEYADLTFASGGFTFQGSPVTGVRVHTNGFLQMINGTLPAPATLWNNTFNRNDVPNVVAPFWEDLINRTSPAPNSRDNCIQYSIVGSTPNRVITIEWSNLTVFGAPGPALYFQVVLTEATNSIAINYGDMQLFNGTTERRYSYSMGLRGSYASTYPTAGQVFAQQFENYNLFSHDRTQLNHYGANGLLVAPEPRTRYVFTPGAYVAPAPPVASAPANDAPGSAELITSLPSFPSNVAWNVPDNKPRIYTTRFATAGGPAICGGPASPKDVWFRFNANEIEVAVLVYPSGGFIPRIQAFDAGLTTSLGCQVGIQGQTTTLSLTGLTIGQDYYVRVSHDRVGTTAVFTGSAIVSGGVTGVSITSGGSGYTVATPTFGGPGGARMVATGGGGTNFIGAVTATTSEQVTGGGFDGGNNYSTVPAIAVESPDWGITGEFAILVYAPPINDNCSGAIALTGVNTMTCNTGTNQLVGISTGSASESGEAVGPCNSFKDDDLWYKFVATGNRSRVNVQGAGGFDPALMLYSQVAGNCVGKAVLANPAGGCRDLTGADGLETVDFTTTPGTTYFVRVYHAAAGFGGPGATFDICVTTLPDVDIEPRALITPPAAGGCGNIAQPVIVRIKNSGATPRLTGDLVTINVAITGAIVTNVNNTIALAADLAVNDSVNLTVGTFDMSANGTYNFAISATGNTPADGNTANDNLASVSRIISKFSVPPAYVDGLNTQGPWAITSVVGTDNWAFTNTAQNNGTTPTVPFFEGTGYLFFDSYNFFPPVTSRAISPCFELPATCSRMTFRMKRDDGFMTSLDEVQVRVSTDGGGSWSAPLTLRNLTLGRDEQAIRPYNEAPPAIQWHQFEAKLSAYTGQTIKIALDAVGDFGNNMMVDDFRVEETVTSDVQPISVVSPAPFFSCGNTSANVVVRFKNNSCFAATNIPYSISVGGSGSPGVLSGVIPNINANSELNVSVGTVTVTGNTPLTFTASTSLPGDEVPGNNSIGPITVPLRPSPTVTSSIADPNLVFGFTTTMTGSASTNSPDANVVFSTSTVLPDPGIVDLNLVVSGMGNLAANQITRATMNMLHTFAGDMIVTLIDPIGNEVILVDSRGGGGDNFQGTIFATGGSSLGSGTAPFTGTFAPEEPFSGFSGVAGSANGTWIIRFEDTFGGDQGTLQNFTITFPNAISQGDWACLTCPNGFPASAPAPNVTVTYPNNPLGVSYPVGIYPISLTVSDRQGCTVVNNQSLNVFTTNVWLGINPGADNWNDPANWIAAPAPPTSLVAVTIPTDVPFAPNVSTVANVGSVTLNANGVINLGGSNLQVAADWSGGLNTVVNGPGSVIFNGPGVQNVAGATQFDNLTVTKATGTVQMNGITHVNNVLTLGSGTSSITVPPSGKLILRSTASGTARLGPVPSGASIIGDLTIQRHIPWAGPLVQGSWFFAGSPISGQNFTDWSDDFRVYGPYFGFGLQGGGIQSVGVQHTSIFEYRQNEHNVTTDTAQKIGWRAPLANIETGRGYRVYIHRPSASKGYFDNSGAVISGTVNFPSLTRNEFANCQPNVSPNTVPCVEDDRGWNLLSNPYPSPIDWDASGVGTWVKPASMNNAFYTWNSQAGNYQVYLGTGGSSSLGLSTQVPANIIPSSQAFFVKMTTPGTYSANLSIGENAKATNSGQFARTNVVHEQVRVRMSKVNGDPNYKFDCAVRFDQTATYGFDQNKDVHSVGGDKFDFRLLGEGNVGLLMNTVPLVNETKVIPMQVFYRGQYGSFTFDFLESETVQNGAMVYLRDNYLGTLTSMISNPSYTFSANQIDGSADGNRFDIVITPTTTTGVIANLNGPSFGVYPNPVNNGSQFTLTLNGVKGTTAVVRVLDVLGKLVYQGEMNVEEGKMAEKSFDLGLASGVYTIKMVTPGKTFTEKLVVR